MLLSLFTFKLTHFDKLYYHVFGDARRITCHFTVLQDFKTHVIISSRYKLNNFEFYPN